ncbi:carbohydrate binding family 9 domain-containing protein [Spirosoma sp. BT702]|uniref:Carbohydrate binding family 9 domain-containing protein n=1 Tax=Spirosoma profusum TaxID=2771354 RepID=A0A927AVT3_9BACT|nr:DUF5916 domain-containing protein [Spirosoma profusum]MBD2705289.1 carbohydrate binding family 9 domain-containing protein [Spirosoma profusum]
MSRAIFTAILLLGFAFVRAQNAPSKNAPIEKRKYYTQRITQPIRLDGIPDESAWNAVEWSGNFTQYQPNEGKAPGQPTLFKILYDDKFLYVGYRCLDAAPDSIIKRMSRRDEFPGDWVEINIDSYYDKRTAFSFSLSVSGVRGDEFISQNGNNWDTSWNPIWYGKTHVDTTGWTAEVKIPLSQLRYGNEADKVWGIQVQRRIFRKEERSVWQYIPQNSGVWVSGFGELHGLKNVPSQKQIEIAPYVVAKTEKYQREEGNPFATGSDSKVSVGLDGKVAVTSDLILDFTVNPDFGQVEADPSRVRIDGFQNFFEERRPFFIESRNIFDYQLTGSEAGGNYDSDLLFYSRRIGGSPHGYPSLAQREYAQVPQNTPILGAAKFSGKTKKGWSIGVLESITGRTMAEIDRAGDRRQETVEPLTSYFVGRLQKDIDAGNTVIGGIFTSVNRENNLNHLLHTNAYSGGLDFLHFWKNRTWYFRGNVIFSQVQGSKEVIANTQRAFEHLFQRSNASEIGVDEGRTSLTGTGGTFRFGKIGGKSGKLGQVFKFETGITYRSPELELNDIGFMLTSNEINHFTWAGLHYQKSFSIFRNARINYNHWSRWDFGGQFLYQAFNSNVHATFRNNWQVGTGATWNPYEVSNNALRGGSSLRLPSGINHWGYIQSDFRKKVLGSVEFANSWGFEHTARSNDVTFTLRVQPLDALNISLSTGYTHNWRRQDQYVGSATYNGSLRTIVSEVNQHTMRYTLRLNYNITPDLTIQYYGQPFITRPTYQHFAYVADPLNNDFDQRFRRFSGSELRFEDGRYVVDENRDGSVDYTFGKPDFNFVQFRSNLVARWEYKPGSELYLVWSQGNTPAVASDLSSPLNRSLFDNLFSQQGRNIFLVKMTYRFLK